MTLTLKYFEDFGEVQEVYILEHDGVEMTFIPECTREDQEIKLILELCKAAGVKMFIDNDSLVQAQISAREEVVRQLKHTLQQCPEYLIQRALKEIKEESK